MAYADDITSNAHLIENQSIAFRLFDLVLRDDAAGAESMLLKTLAEVPHPHATAVGVIFALAGAARTLIDHSCPDIPNAIAALNNGLMYTLIEDAFDGLGEGGDGSAESDS